MNAPAEFRYCLRSLCWLSREPSEWERLDGAQFLETVVSSDNRNTSNQLSDLAFFHLTYRVRLSADIAQSQGLMSELKRRFFLSQVFPRASRSMKSAPHIFLDTTPNRF